MENQVNTLINKVKNHILFETSKTYKTLCEKNIIVSKEFDYLDLSNFMELERLIDHSREVIENSTQRITYFKKVRDGYNLDHNIFSDNIKINLGNPVKSYKEIIQKFWVKDTISYYANRQFKVDLLRKYDQLKSTHKDEYLIYKGKTEVSVNHFEKIKCETDFSRICFIVMELADYGYINLPKKDGKYNRVSIANTIQNIFETKVSNNTILDYLGSKHQRTKTAFDFAIKKSKDQEILKIPPTYSFN